MISAATSRRRSSGRQRVLRALVEIARAAALERDQLPHRFGDDPGGEVVDRASMRPQVVERQVDAPALEVGLDVAQDVGQLQRDAEVERVVARARARGSRRCGCRSCRPPTRPGGSTRTDRRRSDSAWCRDPSRRRRSHPRTPDAGRSNSRDERLQAASLCGRRRPAVERARQLLAPERDRGATRRQRFAAGVTAGASSTASSTARQKSQTATIARRCSGGQDEERVVEAGLARHQTSAGQRAARQSSTGTSRGAERRAVGRAARRRCARPVRACARRRAR